MIGAYRHADDVTNAKLHPPVARGLLEDMLGNRETPLFRPAWAPVQISDQTVVKCIISPYQCGYNLW